ncbi:unnamed protein product [Caenorhabditis auriculariae]|uniref:Uncharacterized protein n=1 Tax=Caenorhabditis auriculariae TaxID=2777116 RepID=A0A8S1HCH2_9PELO|nr:unnamed protein product [Caenorhabditis auriculariae]
MTRLSPDEEASQAYLDIDVAAVGGFSLALSTIFVISAIYLAALPHVLEEAYFTNKTEFVVHNYKTYSNGTLYFDYVNEKGKKEGGILGDWFLRFLAGEYRYSFGNSFANYCWPRVVPTAQWASSTYRAMQHKASVQTLLRSSVLFSMSNSLFQTIVLAHAAIQSSPLLVLSGYGSVAVDVAHSLSSFALTAIHVWQDEKMVFMVYTAADVALCSLVAKLILNVFLDNTALHQLFRIASAITVFLVRPIILSDISTFNKRTVCDSNVYPAVFLAQLLAILVIFLNSLLQIRRLRGIRMYLSSTLREYKFQLSI